MRKQLQPLYLVLNVSKFAKNKKKYFLTVPNVKIFRTISVEMKEKKTIFKKPTVLATLKIPTADEVPYSPSYKRYLNTNTL